MNWYSKSVDLIFKEHVNSLNDTLCLLKRNKSVVVSGVRMDVKSRGLVDSNMEEVFIVSLLLFNACILLKASLICFNH